MTWRGEWGARNTEVLHAAKVLEDKLAQKRCLDSELRDEMREGERQIEALQKRTSEIRWVLDESAKFGDELSSQLQSLRQTAAILSNEGDRIKDTEERVSRINNDLVSLQRRIETSSDEAERDEAMLESLILKRERRTLEEKLAQRRSEAISPPTPPFIDCVCLGRNPTCCFCSGSGQISLK